MKDFEPISQEENNLAYELNYRLVDAVEDFGKQHPGMSINVIFGAANVFMAGWLSNAPSKKVAHEMLDANYAVMRNLIDATPDAVYFPKTINPKLN